MLRLKSAHQRRVEQFMKNAGQAVPHAPTMPDLKTRMLRARLIMEEARETVRALGLDATIPPQMNRGEVHWNNGIGIYERGEPDLIEVADGCADISVVTIGTLSACGISDTEVLEEVDESNLRKFGPGGYRDDGGKWIKPKDWTPPKIKEVLELQGMQ